MRLLNSGLGRTSADKTSGDGDDTGDGEAEVSSARDADSDDAGGRRWLALTGVVVGVAAGVYLWSRRDRRRESEFTEIEIEPESPTPADDGE